jgi:hypothetical protein
VDLHWNTSPYFANVARTVNAKFKQVRAGLRAWSKDLSKISKLIKNCNFVIALLDGLEDQRTLSRPESAFRCIFKLHLASLLEAKRIYWKQRSTSRWVVFGDENSSLFQAMATYSFRKKYITSLTLENGTTIFDHDQKAAALWLSYKDRLGVSEFSDILYDLSELIEAVDLPVLDDPFSQEEIIVV